MHMVFLEIPMAHLNNDARLRHCLRRRQHLDHYFLAVCQPWQCLFQRRVVAQGFSNLLTLLVPHSDQRSISSPPMGGFLQLGEPYGKQLLQLRNSVLLIDSKLNQAFDTSPLCAQKHLEQHLPLPSGRPLSYKESAAMRYTNRGEGCTLILELRRSCGPSEMNIFCVYPEHLGHLALCEIERPPHVGVKRKGRAVGSGRVVERHVRLALQTLEKLERLTSAVAVIYHNFRSPRSPTRLQQHIVTTERLTALPSLSANH
mmetsp:Transcript_7686/g.18714  ORF Transcript_7686/g.18714 Transcript_7686/m.18714 type:complete len:258 (+) Transcript_7686:648-1421(+)